jgi:indole-3-glycerol phosphate synthase
VAASGETSAGAAAAASGDGFGGLERFVRSKRPEIAELARHGPPSPLGGDRPDFRAAIRQGAAARGLAVIAEYKRASPSLGDIDLAMGPEAAAEAFRAADCLSVLTEGDHFKGELGFIGRAATVFGGPILRKDFILSPLQVEATAATEASAVLLIVRLTPDPGLLGDLIAAAEGLGLAAVVEIFGSPELGAARRAGATIIQVNARDLGDLSLDAGRARDLIRASRPDPSEIWIAASGLRAPGDLQKAAESGYHAALVGSALMGAPDKAAALAALTASLAGGRRGREGPGGPRGSPGPGGAAR